MEYDENQGSYCDHVIKEALKETIRDLQTQLEAKDKAIALAVGALEYYAAGNYDWMMARCALTALRGK